MVSFIDEHRDEYGVEPICDAAADRPVDVLRAEGAAGRSGERLPARDAAVTESSSAEIRRVWARATSGVYGARKVWRQLDREGITVARCTVERLMRRMGLCGCRPRPALPHDDRRLTSPQRPLDRVQRRLTATPSEPSCGWRTSRTWRPGRGFVYVAFVIDVFSRRIVGWRVSRSMRAPTWCSTRWSRRCGRAPMPTASWSITATAGSNTCRSATPSGSPRPGIEPSVGSVGDSYDNALAETIIGLYKTEVIDAARTVAHARTTSSTRRWLGRLVQPPAAARADRQHSAGGVRKAEYYRRTSRAQAIAA